MREESLEFVPTPATDYLNPRQAVTYNDHREGLITWLRSKGKNPAKGDGLAETTAQNYASRLDDFYRWVWREYDGFTTRITHTHADAYVTHLDEDEIRKANGEPYAESSKRRTVDAITTLFQWRAEHHGDDPWTPNIDFSDNTHRHSDEFTIDERARLREAVLDYDTIPVYSDLSPEERDRWKAYLAQKLGKAKADVSPDDWNRLNKSWELPSLVWTALDTGFRPSEVEKSNTSWLRLEKGELHIPKEESSKNRDNWEVALQPDTVKALARWLDERENYTKYDGSDSLWLNRKGNPYTSGPLNYLLDNLCEEAGIDQTNRHITWYSIRHSVGTYMTSKGNLAQTKEQLRHKNMETTLRYAHPPTEERADTLEEMG